MFSSELSKPLEVCGLIQDVKITSICGTNITFYDDCGSSPSICFSLKKFDINTKSGISNIYTYCHGSRRITQMTRHNVSDGCSDAKLLVDLVPGVVNNTIAYLKNGQLWQIPLGGGEAWQITQFSLPIICYKIFVGPNDQIMMAVALEVFPSLSLKETAEKDMTDKEDGSSGILFDKLMVRHWDNWGTYQKRNHIFICPLDITPEGLFMAKEDKLIDIMFGLETDCPGKAPGHGEEDFCISSNGIQIAMSCRRTNAVDGSQLSSMAWETDEPVYLVDISTAYGSEAQNSKYELKLISGVHCLGANMQPSFSPDDKLISFTSMERRGYESDKRQIKTYNIAKDAVSCLTNEMDLSFESMAWHTDSTLYCTAQYRGSSRIFRLELNVSINGDDESSLKSCEVMTGDESRHSLAITKISQRGEGVTTRSYLYFIQSSLSRPNEIMMVDITSESTVARDLPLFTTFQFERIVEEVEIEVKSIYQPLSLHSIFDPCPQYTNGDVASIDVKQHYFKGANDDLVHAWYLPPIGLDIDLDAADTPSAPLVLIVHGGPQGAIMNAWNYRWNMGLFASKGYGVLAVNFHGSSGFGQDFMDSIRNDWGGKPFEDCLAGVRYILSKYKYLDKDRVGALGASYGGYMMNWMNGHTDMFKCLVNHDGIFSLKSLYYTTDELWFPEWEFSLPWVEKESYHRWSPDSYVESWKTPVLVVQGGLDYRVCETEGLSTFTALQRRGIRSKLLYFPNENHWVLKPLNSQKWYKSVFDWLAEFLMKS